MRVACAMVRHAAWVVFVAVGLTTGVARGEFALVEDFDDLALGPIDGQDGWQAVGLGEVVTLPGEGPNQSLKVTATPGVLHKGARIPDLKTRTLFLRFRFEGQHAYSFGMSHYDSPTEIGHFAPELRRVTRDDWLEIHNGLNYDRLTTLEPETWYNLWALVNNDSDDTQVWLHSRPGEAATPGDQLHDSGGETVFNFRSETDTDLVKFYIKAADGGSGRDPFWIDDIYLEAEDGDAPNLTNPVPEPNSLICLASFALALICYLRGRRRRT